MVLTGTARQAAELLYAWAYEHRNSSSEAWTTPYIKSLSAWTSDQYELLARRGISEANRGLMPESALDLGFRLTAPTQEDEKHARAAARAWNTYRLWNLQRVNRDLQQTEDGRLFSRWVKKFEEFLADQEFITHAELPSILTEAVQSEAWRESNITLFGCDDLSVSQRDLVNALNRNKLLAASLSSASPHANKHQCVSYESVARERCAYAEWAREQLALLGETGRIGVVLPDIQGNYVHIRRHWEAAFFDADDLNAIVNIGTGSPLAETRLCQDIMKFLLWTTTELGFEEILQLGRSPYLQGLEIPFEFPEHYPDRMMLQGFASRKRSDQLLQITRLLSPSRNLVSNWAETALSIFGLVEWSTESESAEDQATRDALVDVFNGVSRMSPFIGRTTWGHMIALIRDGVSGHQQSYHSHHAPIQVVTREDSKKLEFDALWVANVGENNWPPDPHPNPMIPISVQRKAQVPRTTYTQTLQYAQHMSAMWVGSAPVCVFSSSKEAEEEVNPPSRLFIEHPLVEREELLISPSLAEHDHPWATARQEEATEEFLSDKGSDLPEGTEQEISSAFIRDQSMCPFRGWAIHRAGLKDGRSPRLFPDAMDRGSVVHAVLQKIVEMAQTQGEIASLSDAQITVAIDEAMKTYSQLQLPDRFLSVEKERIFELVAAWREFEAQRGPFEVIAVEKDVQLKLEGFELNLRIDRVDKTDDLSSLVIDYKTSTSYSTNDWRIPRPQQPQMPLYALALEDCDGLVYQIVLAEKCSFKGFAATSEARGIQTNIDDTELSFVEYTEQWQDSLKDIAQEFKAGRAVVSPWNDNACRYCHLKSFCRVFTNIELTEPAEGPEP